MTRSSVAPSLTAEERWFSWGPDTSSNAGRQRHRTDAARGGLADESATLAKLRPGTYKVTARSVQVATGPSTPSPKRKVVTVKRGKLTKVTVRYSTSVGPAALADSFGSTERDAGRQGAHGKPARQHRGTTRRRGRKGQGEGPQTLQEDAETCPGPGPRVRLREPTSQHPLMSRGTAYISSSQASR